MQPLEIKIEFVDFIPEELKYGVLYISKKFMTSQHLCPCGCKNHTVIPFAFKKEKYRWEMTDNNGVITFDPSLLNSGFPCKSHYFIRDNKIIWA